MLLPIIAATVVLLTISTLILCTLRLLYILPHLRGPPPPRKSTEPAQLLVVLGSGGHTAEMLAMLEGLDTRRYMHRTYIVSAGDALSGVRAHAFEAEMRAAVGEGAYGAYDLHVVPRARNIHQSLLTTPISCVWTLLAALRILRASAPDIILANGPATAAIVIFAQILLRFCDIGGSLRQEHTRIVYVESMARVRTLSLSAQCVAWCVDRLCVQWEELKGQARGKAEYVGLVIGDGG
jgi:beta-1,4-N-acetylglucosaminyltransferase